ncbi:hypothetical protein [Streptomyces sp. NBC_01320]|uniref:hypothetical protein n=1 Tax=Streptomyces sp. NBC_01320 TaxID=2903824 RepID=UPI002E15E682|nr:hypothetical protein OG395_56575 [Streptomyces sp. NBC_01320]
MTTLPRKVRRQPLCHACTTALDLVRGYDFIAHEGLKVRRMSATLASKPDPGQPGAFQPNGAAAKAGLNRLDR